MSFDVILELGINIYSQISMPDGGRIILANPGYGWMQKNTYAINHNIFRIDIDENIVWQIERFEDHYVNWESRKKHANEDDPECDGYLDPFIRMGDKFFERRPLPYKGPFHPTFEIVAFDNYKPGRLLGAATYRWGYDIDPETGIATCTGEQMK